MPSPSSTPVVVAGMHRSGTSMTASLVQALGVDVGRDLMAGDVNNRPGYFEDWDFVKLHQALFRAACPPGEDAWSEVGWTASGALDPAAVEAFRPQAAALVAARAELPVWGWKDPRTTLLLPFWRSLLPETARWVLVYRAPWDVVGSLLRFGHAELAGRPALALAVWTRYNRQVLDFARAHPATCVLASAKAVATSPGRFAALLGGKLGLPVAAPGDPAALAGLVDQGLMTDLPADDPLVALYATHHPEAVALLADLEAAADLPGEPLPAAHDAGSALAGLHRTLATAAAARAALEARLDEAGRHAADLRAVVAAREDEIAGLRAARDAGEARAAAREQDLAAMRASTSWRLTAPLRGFTRVLRPGADRPRDGAP